MAGLAESSRNGQAHVASPLFLILSDLPKQTPAWPLAEAQIGAIRDECASVLGFEPDVRLVPAVEMSAQPDGETFVIPAALDFSLWERDTLGQRLAEERRNLPNAVIHHDDVDPCHLLVVHALGTLAATGLQEITPQKSGLILAASGHEDSGSRSQTYRLMRLLWEQLGFARGEVAFVRNSQPFLAHVLEQRAVRSCGAGLIARVTSRDLMAEALSRILPPGKPERVLGKVTWHGYATGTYTDAAALDLLLSALPSPAVILEGHTSSRNLGGEQFDRETDARQNRAWIRQQDAEYLRRTGLQNVLTRHQAEYVNVTEAVWDEDCPGDPAQFVPEALTELRGCPMLSFAKFKGPTRLGIANLFGLIPLPLRSANRICGQTGRSPVLVIASRSDTRRFLRAVIS